MTDADGEVVAIHFAQAARISWINKGLRRRTYKNEEGFSINPVTGSKLGEKKEEGADGGEYRPEKSSRKLSSP